MRHVAAALICVLFAGCSQGMEGADPRAIEEDELASDPQVELFSGTHTVVGYCSEEIDAQMVGTFTLNAEPRIPNGTAGAVFEARWAGTSAAACLYLVSPSGVEVWVMPGPATAVDPYLAHVLADPEPGTWEAQVVVQGPADIAFDIAVSSFAGPVPDGYSAW